MRRKRLLWQVYPWYLVLTLVSLTAVAWYACSALREFYHEQSADDLKSRARLVAEEVRPLLIRARFDEINALCKRLGGKASTRITVILPDGKVVGDSAESPAEMEDHSDRPEVVGALAGRIRPAVRLSGTVKRRLMYLAVAVHEDGKPIGVVRAAVPATSTLAATLRRFYLDQTATDLLARARLVEDMVRNALQSGRPHAVDALCKRLGRSSATRITVILPDGKVVGDSEEDPGAMGNHANRREVVAALAGDMGRSLRYSATLQEQMMYLAIPLQADGNVSGVLRMSIPATAINRALSGVRRNILAGVVVVALLVAGISLLVSRRVARPLEELKRGAERFARGELDHNLTVKGPQEIAALADTMNRMAAELDDRIRAVVEERNERGAILASMAEGVLAVDASQRVLNLNRAAARLMGVDPQAARGRSLHEVVRNQDLQQLVAGALARQEPLERELLLYENEERTLRAHGTVLRDADGEGIGALVVLNDVTRLKRLENVRRDFVANVSHELKTPVTSIMGFVETLLDGAMDDPRDARRFLQIVAAQTDRLRAIVDDLLDLSRIEQEAEQNEIELRSGPLKDVLEAAVEACRPKATEKRIRIDLSCDDDLQAAFDAQLLEQAVVNLIDNAVKYSPAGETVFVEADGTDGEVVVRVRDRGCGIEREHLPRIFERFYRVDKARSRKLGGTGLGLAIVKHIAQAHGGRATVESTPGEGSVFAVHLSRG